MTGASLRRLNTRRPVSMKNVNPTPFYVLVAMILFNAVGVLLLLNGHHLTDQAHVAGAIHSDLLGSTLFRHHSTQQQEPIKQLPSSSPKDYVLPYPRFRLSPTDVSGFQSADRVIHVLSHSHWDREWYLSQEEFRGSLLQEVDRVLSLLSNSTMTNFLHFHFDGQFLMVEDYLQVRESMKKTVQELNQAGKLTLGPFYSQPDVFLSSGEALIRNLLLGMSLSSEYGGTSRVGFLPDSFGFMGQLPQLLLGFDIPYFVSGRFRKAGVSEGYWEAPDGSRVLYAFLANWYCHAAHRLGALSLTANTKDDAAKVLRSLDLDFNKSGAQSKHRLAMYGCDHYMTHPDIGLKVKALNDAAIEMQSSDPSQGRIQAIQTNIDDYMSLVEEDLETKESSMSNSSSIKGEVRDGVDSLINSASTKMSMKQKNFQIQTLLETWVEPLEAYGWALLGRKYDYDILWHTWKPVLQSHAHDSICATSSSTVIHDVMNRLDRSLQSGYRMVADQAGDMAVPLAKMLLDMSKQSKTDIFDSSSFAILFNPSNTIRSEHVAVTIYGPSKNVTQFDSVQVFIKDGSFVQNSTVVLLRYSKEPQETYELPKVAFRKRRFKTSATYLISVQNFPPLGVALLKFKKTRKSRRKPFRTLEQGPRGLQKPLFQVLTSGATSVTVSQPSIYELVGSTSPLGTDSADPTISNQHIEVTVNTTDGSCTIQHLASGHMWPQVNQIRRAYERGTSYLHAMVGYRLQPLNNVRIVSNRRSKAFASITVRGSLNTKSNVTIAYVLFAGGKSLQIETTIDNKERDHFVTAGFPVVRQHGQAESFNNDDVVIDVDGNFEYVDRTYLINRTGHQNRFTSTYSPSGKSSLTVAARGVPEYKISRIEGTASWDMTLLRGVNRIGDWIAGEMADDISQELGISKFTYAVTPDTCRVADPGCSADIEARNFVNPMQSWASWVNKGYRPERYMDMANTAVSDVASASHVEVLQSTQEPPVLMNETSSDYGALTAPLPQFFQLTPPKLILSSVKKAESQEALVVRVYNPTHITIQASIGPRLIQFNRVYLASLNETKLIHNYAAGLTLNEKGNFQFPVGPYKIITLLVFPKR